MFSSHERFTQMLETGRQVGAVDYYFALSGTLADDYRTGRGSAGRQPNTGYDRYAANFSLGYDMGGGNRLDVGFRHDALVNAGNHGQTYSLTNYDERFNTGVDVRFTGATADERVRMRSHGYWVRDTDEFYRSQDPLTGLLSALVAPGLIGTRRGSCGM